MAKDPVCGMKAKGKELRVLHDDVIHKMGRNRDDGQKDKL